MSGLTGVIFLMAVAQLTASGLVGSLVMRRSCFLRGVVTLPVIVVALPVATMRSLAWAGLLVMVTVSIRLAFVAMAVLTRVSMACRMLLTAVVGEWC